MTFENFLTRIVDDGIKACQENYKGGDTRQQQKREGATAGFESCRGKTVFELRQQLDIARKLSDLAFVDKQNYWYHRCFYAEVEWVCNVVSAALENQKQPGIVQVTARGFLKAAEILGVARNMELKEFN